MPHPRLPASTRARLMPPFTFVFFSVASFILRPRHATACFSALCCLILSASPAHATERPPVEESLLTFGSTWHLQRTDRLDPTQILDAADRARGGWWEARAPFIIRNTKSKRHARTKGTELQAGAKETPLILATDFELSSPEELQSLLIESRFIGGFAVFLNGRELMRHHLDLDNAPTPILPVIDPPGTVREGRGGFSQRVFRGLDPTALREGVNTLVVVVYRHPEPWGRDHLLLDLRLVGFRSNGFIKGPYLQRVSKTEATVMFETAAASVPYVEFGRHGALSQTVTTPSAAGTLHEVRLTGLDPAQRYFYRVRLEQTWPPQSSARTSHSYVYHFETSTRDDATSLNFMAYGDNRSQPKVHGAMVQRMLSERAELVINTGDLTEHGTDYREWQEEFFEPARPLMAYLPLWPSMGNHDGNHISYFENFSLPNNEAWYSFRRGPVEFFALNTGYKVNPSSPQYQWFEAALAASTAPWKVAFFHHPPFSCTASRLPGFRPVREHIQPLLERYGVQIVFSGHDHLYARGHQNGVTYIITGGGGAYTYPPTVKPPNILCRRVYHYCWVRIDRDELHLKAIDIDGKEIDAFVITR